MKKAFTLIELMVVISVIAILATIALFGFGKAQSSARDVARAQIMRGVQTALESYYGDNGRYPTTNGDVGTRYPNCANFSNWSQGGFGGLVNLLKGLNYLSGPVKDPTGNRDISCGAVCPAPGGSNCEWGDVGKGAMLGDTCGWDHCSLFGYMPWPAGYHYSSSNGQSYSLILVKESGGVQEFKSPQ